MVKIGIYSVVTRNLSVEDFVKECSRIGYSALEIRGQSGESFHIPAEYNEKQSRELKDLSDRCNTDIFDIGTYNGKFGLLSDKDCQGELTSMEKYMKTAAALGAKYVRVETARQASANAEKAVLNKDILWFQKTADLAKGYSLSLLIEIHGGCLTDTCKAAKRFIEMTGRDNIKVTFDVGNLYDSGFEYGADEVRLLKDYIVNVHVRDDRLQPGTRQPEYVRMGEGAIDYIPIFHALEDIGFSGYLTDECHANPQDHGGEIALAAYEYGYIKALAQQVFGRKNVK